MSNQDPQFAVTGKVRLSFVHVFAPFAAKPGNEPKYSVTILVSKSDIGTMQRISAAIEAATQQGVATKWNNVRPPLILLPVYDGDGVRPSDGMPFSDECKGHWVFTASDKNRPEVVDLTLNPILNQTEVYSGMYARVSVRFFPYVNTGKKGVGCGLRNIQKLEDGEPLGGGRSNAADDFGGAPAAAPGYPQQSYQQPPVQQPAQPVYAQQPYQQQPVQPVYAQQTPVQQPVYTQQPVQPTYQQQPIQQPVQPQYDPITGKPITGGVMGL